MKFLSMNVKFILPDGFEGDLSDALVLLAEYHKENKHKEKIEKNVVCQENMSVKEYSQYLYDKLWDAYVLEGSRWTGLLCFSEYDKEKQQWTIMER